MAIKAFSDFTMTISDGGTVPSVDYLQNKTYINIGSGNILKMSWDAPVAEDNAVDSYVVHILAYDTNSASYRPFYTVNIGNVNEYYLKSNLFNTTEKVFFQLHIYIEVISKYGAAYNCVSNVESINVSKGCGTFTKVSTEDSQPVMKRSVAFAKLDLLPLYAEDGTQVTDSSGTTILGKLSNVQDEASGWTLMQEFKARDANGNWHDSDIKYEILTNTIGEAVTDINNEIIYIL